MGMNPQWKIVLQRVMMVLMRSKVPWLRRDILRDEFSLVEVNQAILAWSFGLAWFLLLIQIYHRNTMYLIYLSNLSLNCHICVCI